MNQELKQQFLSLYGSPAQYIFSAPGRSELSGNHTDHQRGCVLACAVDLDARAAVAPNGTRTVRVTSEGYAPFEVSLDDLEPRTAEYGTTPALVRGVASCFAKDGAPLIGFDAYVRSSVLSGSGLSSSAAFEVLFGVIFNYLCGAGKTAVELAQIGQYAENVFFGKPCGLMDQTASAVGGVIGIDFADPAAPEITQIPFDVAACGHALCIIDSGASHADLTDEYAAIPSELKSVCAHFGKEALRDVPEADFYAHLPELREHCGDRAVLRAIHVYDENQRVKMQLRALKNDNFDAFLQYVRDSGRSSWHLLQNIVPTGQTAHQEVALALALTEKLLDGHGACRVHGGGFAGTIQAFVPNEMLEAFRERIESYLGAGCCHVLSFRELGGVLLEDLR